ncbi:MAG: NAD-dependent epimerase/dehydratase family protein, partial [Acidimicrobiales bacterium]
MKTVAVTAADQALGSRVVERLERDPEVDRVVAVALAELPGADLKRVFDPVDAVVHLAATTTEPVEPTRRVLEAASAAGASALVVVTSALVYGAWPTNPVPLTEDAPLHPNPGFGPAVGLSEVERLCAEWRDDHPGATVAVLRPAVPVAEDDAGWLAPMLHASRGVPVADDDPPGQFVHLDDLADAVDLVRRAGIDGPRNVAPDSWIGGEALRALAGRPRVRLPGRLAERFTRWRWRAGLSPTPPGLLPWTMHAWVVANDRLRSDGWTPAHSNEEAFVAGHRPPPWATISPQ